MKLWVDYMEWELVEVESSKMHRMSLISKSEILNYKQIPKLQTTNSKQYDLENRTYLFAHRHGKELLISTELMKIFGSVLEKFK